MLPEQDVIIISSPSKFRKALADKRAEGWQLMGPVTCLSVGEGWFVGSIERPDRRPDPMPTLPLEQQ